MSITPAKLLRLLYGQKLPQIYRDEDKKIGYPLKRFLESLIDGGYRGSIEDIEGILNLIDPNTIPEEYLQYLCESFGLDYFPDIDATYQRKFISNMGELIKRRGTFASVRYLVRVLTGLEVELSYKEGEYNGVEGNYLYITLIAKDLEQTSNMDVSRAVLQRYIGTQIPYYVTPIILSKIETQVIDSTTYSHSIVGSFKSYVISRASTSGDTGIPDMGNHPLSGIEANLINGALMLTNAEGALVPTSITDSGNLSYPSVNVIIDDSGLINFTQKEVN